MDKKSINVSVNVIESGVWHNHLELVFQDNSINSPIIFNIYETKMGCGLLQMFKICDNESNDLEELDDESINFISNYLINELVNYTDNYSNMEAGLIICTLGEDFRNNYEDFILKLGFEELSEYNNWRHGYDETQKLYGLKTNYGD